MFIAAGSHLSWTNYPGKSLYDLIFEDQKIEETGGRMVSKTAPGIGLIFITIIISGFKKGRT